MGILFYKNEYSYFESKLFPKIDEIDFSYEMQQNYNINGAFGIGTTYRIYERKASDYHIADPERAINYMLNAIKMLKKEIRNEKGESLGDKPIKYYSECEYEDKLLLSKYYYNLGVCYYKNNDIKKAFLNFNNAIIIDKDNKKAENAIFVVLKEMRVFKILE